MRRRIKLLFPVKWNVRPFRGRTFSIHPSALPPGLELGVRRGGFSDSLLGIELGDDRHRSIDQRLAFLGG